MGTRSSRFPPSTASGIEEGVGSRTTSQHSRLSFDPGGLTAAGARDRAVLASPSRCCGCGAQSQCAQGHPPRFTSQRPGHARGAGLLLERSATLRARFYHRSVDGERGVRSLRTVPSLRGLKPNRGRSKGPSSTHTEQGAAGGRNERSLCSKERTTDEELDVQEVAPSDALSTTLLPSSDALRARPNRATNTSGAMH